MIAPNLIILFFFLSTATVAFALYGGTASATFIRKSCTSTSYPSLCFAALAPYSAAVRNNPIQLALLATNLSLSAVESAAANSAVQYKKAKAADPKSRATKALKDCREVLGDAVDDVRYSVSQLKAMRGSKGTRRRWALSNAQTYASAALTKEDTCVDGLNEMGVAAKAVRRRVVRAEKYTSVALGLVNLLRRN